MDKKPISNTLQKTKNFRENQENIIKLISKKCNQTTFVENIQSDENQIKHFNLPDGTHVYSLNTSNSSKPSRLISSVELPKIKYFKDHWNPMLVPDENLSEVNGTYIYINPNSICYTSFLNGKTLFEAGYNFDLNDNTKTNFFCNFGFSHFGKTFNNLPNNVNNILELLDHGYNHYGSNYSKLVSNYQTAKKTLYHLENGTIDQLNFDVENEIINQSTFDVKSVNIINEKKGTNTSNKLNISTNLDNSICETIAPLPENYNSEISYSNIEPKTEKQVFYDSLKVSDSQLESVKLPIDSNNTSINKQSKFKNKLLGLFKKHSIHDRDDE